MLAVIFPGIGYHKDKPLLYYSVKLAKAAGYEVEFVDFSGIKWDKGDLRDKEKMNELYRMTCSIAEEQLAAVHFEEHEECLFISKSIGTAVAADYAVKQGINARHIFFSPVTLFPGSEKGIAFAGDRDPLADYGEIEEICKKTGTELHRIPGGNHSLETGDVAKDLDALVEIMEKVKAFCGRG